MTYISLYQIEQIIIRIEATSKGILSISGFFEPSEEEENENIWTEKAKVELDEYYHGKRKEFDLPLVFRGTQFQNEVWKALQTIPYGTTVSYQDIAKKIGRARACQAVGTAIGKNPFLIVVPCHRVISANGGIGGFALGLGIKQKLLKLEGVNQFEEIPLL